MMHLEIEQKNLKAVSLAMAVKDIRYYLQGVLIESNGRETRLVATDGHRLHAVIQESDQPMREPESFIMPLEMVKKCVSAKAPKQDRSPLILIDYEAGKITAKLPDGSSIVYQATDGRFPDYTRIIPREIPGTPEAAVFNPEYVADAVKGYCLFVEHSGKTPPAIGLRPNGSACGFLSAGGFTAIVMPMRAELSPNPDVRLTMPLQSPAKLEAVA